MIRFEDILDKVEAYNPQCDQDRLRRAYVFSAREHRGQVRRSGEPYLVHPLHVAAILAEMKADDVSIVVGLLHDVLEDTLTTKTAIAQQFGDEVADLVDGLTKIGKFSYVSREEEQAETFRKMVLAMVSDLRVVLVKLADRLHNMRTLEFLPEGKRQEIARETMDIYAPIAHRLGMGLVNAELEELAFRHLEPEEYRRVVAEVERRMKGSRATIEQIRGELQKKLVESSIPGEVTGRMKRYYSIASKMRRRGVEVAQLYDILAFRIVTPETRDCYAALGLVHQLWRPVPGRIKDYIAMPKPNFYQSLHTTVVGEAAPDLRGPDPHAGDGPHRGAGHRRALEVQGGAAGTARRRRPVPVAAAARGLAERGVGPAAVPVFAEDRPLPRRGLHVHPEGGGLRLPEGGDPGGLRLPGPHGRRASLRRRPRERKARAAAHGAQERRHRGDRDGREPGPVARLAQLHRHEPGPPQDPPLHPHAGEAARRSSWAGASSSGR